MNLPPPTFHIYLHPSEAEAAKRAGYIKLGPGGEFILDHPYVPPAIVHIIRPLPTK